MSSSPCSLVFVNSSLTHSPVWSLDSSVISAITSWERCRRVFLELPHTLGYCKCINTECTMECIVYWVDDTDIVATAAGIYTDTSCDHYSNGVFTRNTYPHHVLHNAYVWPAASQSCLTSDSLGMSWATSWQSCQRILWTLPPNLNACKCISLQKLCLTLPVIVSIILSDMAVLVSSVCYYRTLAKLRPWALHLTFSKNRGVGALSSVSAFSPERAPTFVYVHK